VSLSTPPCSAQSTSEPASPSRGERVRVMSSLERKRASSPRRRVRPELARGEAARHKHGHARGCGTDPGDVVDVHGVVADERHHDAVGHLLDRAAQHLDGPHVCARSLRAAGGSRRFGPSACAQTACALGARLSDLLTRLESEWPLSQFPADSHL